MNTLRNIVLLSALSIGISHANTVPCNGFKIDFKNVSQQNLVIDKAHFTGANITTADSANMGLNKNLIFTVNQSVEGGVMLGEFLFHTTTEPLKELRVNFNLTNKNMVCEVSNVSKQGALDTNFHRVLGGVYLPIKD